MFSSGFLRCVELTGSYADKMWKFFEDVQNVFSVREGICESSRTHGAYGRLEADIFGSLINLDIFPFFVFFLLKISKPRFNLILTLLKRGQERSNII